MRLDVYLVEQKGVATRSKAVQLIEKGYVLLNGSPTTKKNTDVKDDDTVVVTEDLPYVSRGGEKLSGALRETSLDVTGYTVLDVGSSTGGFTDCVLKAGAKSVVAVDVGTQQMDASLRSDVRVELHEETDIRSFETGESFDLIIGDISFISWSYVCDAVTRLSHTGTQILLLIKPQFEVGKTDIRKGIVDKQDLHERVRADVKKLFEERGFVVKKEFESPIKGGDGNTEFFLYGIYEG